MSKKTQKKIEELLFEVYEKGLQQETTDLTAYYKKIEQALNIPVVSKTFTAEFVVNELEDCDTLDDAIMYFKQQM